MKFLVNIFLFIFITFLSTPTFIGIIDERADTSYFFNLCEEEENHASFNEIKSVQTINFSVYSFPLTKLAKLNYQVDHLLRFANLAHQIFSPPPNFL